MVWTGESELIGSWKIRPMRAAADAQQLARLRSVERRDVDRPPVAVASRMRPPVMRAGLSTMLQQRAGGDALARAALADEAERLAALAARS